MAFVELDRNFVKVGKDQEPHLEIGRLWGRKYAGWLNWGDLRKHRRVVLLAEAASGKTEEFLNQADTLRASGTPAFFVTIENLADGGLNEALEPPHVAAFDRWLG